MPTQLDFFVQARNSAIEWARSIVSSPPGGTLILDTETTGLGFDAEVIQIAMIDLEGNEVLNTLVKPMFPIPAEATAIHGITNAMVANALTWKMIYPVWYETVTGKKLIIYNAEYDTRIIRQSCRHWGIYAEWPLSAVHCAMLNYSEYFGQWNDTRGGFRWQKLSGGDHSALGDCKATLDLIFRMADSEIRAE